MPGLELNVFFAQALFFSLPLSSIVRQHSMNTCLKTIFYLAAIFCPLFYTFPCDQINYHGTLRVVAAFDNGLVIAADAKGSTLTKNQFEQTKNGTLRNNLMYHQKLFPIGNNLCAAFGGQILRDADSIMLPEYVIGLFNQKFSLNPNMTLNFVNTANNLYNFFINLYYKQPEMYQIMESSIFLAGIDDGNNLAIIFVNSSGNRSADSRDACIIYSNFNGVLRHGPHWKKAETIGIEKEGMCSAILIKIQKNIPLIKKEAIDYTVWLMKFCVENEIKINPKEERKIDYPINYAILEKNKPIQVKEITN